MSLMPETGDVAAKLQSRCLRMRPWPALRHAQGNAQHLYKYQRDKRPTVVSGADAFSGRRGCYTDGDCEWLQRTGWSESLAHLAALIGASMHGETAAASRRLLT